jgi:hypothetical protein
MRQGVLFIAPRQLGAVGDQFGRHFLPSVEWCTGQSGAPPAATVVVWCAISFHIGHNRSLVLGIGWRTGHCPVHTGQSGVPNRPLLRATRRPWIAQPTVGRERLWLTGQSGAPLDSPVIYSHVAFSFPESAQLTPSQPGAPDTVGCTTEQSGVPGPSWCWLTFANFSPIRIFFSWHSF